MSLLDEVRAETRRSGIACTVQTALGLAPADLRAEMIEALADRSCQSSALARVLKRRGLELTEGSIARHRRGACVCHSETR